MTRLTTRCPGASKSVKRVSADHDQLAAAEMAFRGGSRTNLRSHKRTFNEVTYVSEITSGVDRRHTRAKPATGGIATAVRFRPIPL